MAAASGPNGRSLVTPAAVAASPGAVSGALNDGPAFRLSPVVSIVNLLKTWSVTARG
jgi:hypothetical protein